MQFLALRDAQGTTHDGEGKKVKASRMYVGGESRRRAKPISGEMISQNAAVRAAACRVVRHAAAVSSARSAGSVATMCRAATACVASATVFPDQQQRQRALKAPNCAGVNVRAATKVCA